MVDLLQIFKKNGPSQKLVLRYCSLTIQGTFSTLSSEISSTKFSDSKSQHVKSETVGRVEQRDALDLAVAQFYHSKDQGKHSVQENDEIKVLLSDPKSFYCST